MGEGHSSCLRDSRSWRTLENAEDLSVPYPGFGLGALDPFHGYVVYRLLDEDALADEIREMKTIVERSYRDLVITQDLGLGMMLWMTSFFPEERWAVVHRERSLAIFDRMWIDPLASSWTWALNSGSVLSAAILFRDAVCRTSQGL